jgi:hypothetical protein
MRRTGAEVPEPAGPKSHLRPYACRGIQTGRPATIYPRRTPSALSLLRIAYPAWSGHSA